MEDYDYTLYKGKTDRIKFVLSDPDSHTVPPQMHLNGNENGSNLIPCDFLWSDYLGTILTPCQWIIGKKGEVIPGPVYHRLVEIKELYTIEYNKLVPSGLFFDLTPYTTQLQFYSEGKVEIGVVREAAIDELKKHHEQILTRHRGPVLRGTAVFDPRCAEDEIFISQPMEDLFISQTGVSIRGRNSILYRFPVIGAESIQILKVRVINDDVLAFRMNDVTIKAMGGDFDGDPLQLTFRLDNLEEVGEDLPTIPPLPDPDVFITDWDISQAKAHAWPTGVMTGVGLTTKGMQGIITNFFKRLGLLANQLDKEGK